jgi:HPt (histidine-containing phosphotransfer) domain-containing protein
MAPVRTEAVGAQVCPRGSVLDIVYNEYRDSLDRLLKHIRSYDERVHGALQVDPFAEYQERWRVYQTIAIEYASAAEQSPEDADYAGELALRNAEICKKRDLIVLYAASLEKDSRALAHPDEWFDHLDYLIAAAQKEWDEMVDMRRVYPEDE